MSETIPENPPNGRNRLFTLNFWQGLLPWMLIFGTILVMLLLLRFEGRIWWCNWDTPLYLITFDAWSKHTSQHLFDPYSLTHLLHGVLFLWLLDLFVHKIFKRKISFAWLLLWAVFAEAAWEILENSPMIIERYRESTASLDYFGDSIANSLGDIISCALGFIIAYELKFRRALILFIVIEIFLTLTIRDSLLINILMLIYPIEAVKAWQTGVLFIIYHLPFVIDRF